MIRDLRRLARRLVRYASVSAIATASSLSVLAVLVATGFGTGVTSEDLPRAA